MSEFYASDDGRIESIMEKHYREERDNLLIEMAELRLEMLRLRKIETLVNNLMEDIPKSMPPKTPRTPEMGW